MGLSIGDVFKPNNLLMVAATAGVGAAFAPGGFALATFFKLGATVLALQAVSLALTKEPKEAFPGYTSGQITLTSQEPAASRKMIYGRVRVGGTIVYKESTHNDRLLHLIVALADHEVEAIEHVFFNDELSTSPKFYEPIITTNEIEITSGLKDSQWYLQDTTGNNNMSDLFGGETRGSLQVFEISGSDSGNDGLYEIRDTADQDITATWVAISRIDGGTITAEDPYTASPTYNLTFAFTYAKVNKHLGTADQTADSDLSSYSSQIDSNFRLRGIAYIYVMLVYRKSGGYEGITQSSHPFAQGLPNITAIVKGTKVSWTSPHSHVVNAAAVIRHYIEDTRHGLGGTVNSSNYTTAFNACDTSVNSLWQRLNFDGGTVAIAPGETIEGLSSGASAKVHYIEVTSGDWQDDDAAGYMLVGSVVVGPGSPNTFWDDELLRSTLYGVVTGWAVANGALTAWTTKTYTINALIDTGLPRQRILQEMRKAIAGDIVYSQGEWYILPGVYTAPHADHDFDESDIRSSISVVTALESNAGINAVRGTFTSLFHMWQPTDFPALESSEYLAQDDGVKRWGDLELPYVTDPGQAQRISKIELLKARQPLTVQCELSHKGFQLRAGDRIRLSFTKFGWTNKIFRVVEWSFRLGEDMTLTCPVTLREDDSTIYDWTSNEESSIDPSPNTNLPDPFSVARPENVQLFGGDDQLFIGTDGHVYDRVLMTWDQTNDIYVRNNGHFEIAYRLLDRSTQQYDWMKWYYMPRVLGNVTKQYISGIPSATTYDFIIRAVNSLGYRSNWRGVWGWYFAGKSTPPPKISYFTVHRQADGTREYNWIIENPPLDFAGVKIRYATSTGSYVRWNNMTRLYTVGANEGIITVSPWENNLLGSGDYVFSIIGVDTSGHPSDLYLGSLTEAEEQNQVLQIGVELGDPRITDILEQFDFVKLGWPGTKTDCHVDPLTGALMPDGTDTWATGSPNTWSGISTWNDNPVGQFSYVHTTIDLTGGSSTVTFTPFINILVDGNATTYERHGEGGSPQWTEWAILGPTITTRYIEIKIEVTT